MSPTVLLTLAIFTVFIFNLSLIQCEDVDNNQPGVLFSCCKLQSSLNSLGYCEQPSSSEFEIELFEPWWRIPTSLINNEYNNNNAAPEAYLKIQTRFPLCSCVKNKKLEIKFQKNFDGRWTPKKTIPNGISIAAQGYLFFDGKQFGNKQYCLNKLAEDLPYGESQAVLDVEIIVCTEICHDTFQRPMIISPKSYIEKQITSNCDDWESMKISMLNSTETEEPCKWAVLYHKEEKFYLVDVINTTSNTTKINYIEDHTYPWALLPKNTYCRTGSHEEDTELGFFKFCITEIKKLFVYYQELYAILAGVSAIFLLFNLTIYFSLRESLSISGWTEFLYSLSLYMYCVLSIPALLIVPDSADIRNTCYALSVLIQFFELANGATLVALSFDILWTFCRYDKKGYTDDPKVSKLRLSIYVIFSLAFPLAVVCYGLAKNHRPWDFNYDDHSGIPQYGLFHCTAPDWPMSSYTGISIQGINLVLALISAYVILNKQRLEENVEHFLDPDRLDIFSKLFVYIFVFWILDFIQFFLQGELFTHKWYLVAFYVLNYIQGIFTFLILVCNRQTLRGLRRKNWSLKDLFYHACCSCSKNVDKEDILEEAPLSPLMSQGSFRRSTIRGNAFY